MNTDDLPSAGTDPFASPPKPNSPRSGSCLSWGLIAGGALLLLFGCIMTIGAFAVQLEGQGDPGGFSAFLVVCFAPILVVGIILLILGALPLVRKRQIEESQSNSSPP